MTDHDDKELSTKEIILNTALRIIQQEGLESVTLRKIASSANVNLALVNYYFGSKDNLISEALKLMFDSKVLALDILDDRSVDPITRYRRYMLHCAKMLQEQPDLLRQMLGNGNIKFDTAHEYVGYLKKLGASKIISVLREITGEEDSEVLASMMMQIHAACFFPTFLMRHRKFIFGEQQSLPIERQIDLLFDHYFSRYKQSPTQDR
ncbi:TetR/AcrR family transcriptional regulator [Cohnella zeiphila]|uniref:TetR family transcriptional regulator n=1 Tax=Cohnella zeiphila TaxID=2761120 RepID=A0A7X0SR39_9BACL|nr:TetR family transcriptional regulator [Cohnella zeiphila]MBB6733559.1 TetR family transcriptional regulator [Cohnella zeiphila]